MNPTPVTPLPSDFTPTIQCQILISDAVDAAGVPHITVEMRSSNPDVKESTANLFTAWLASNWDELVLMFRAQLKAHEQERTGTQDVAASTPGPKLLGADGKAYVSSEDCGQISDTGA